MTREEERLRRFDILIDLHYAARVAGFSRVHADTVRWTQIAPFEEIERVRNQRLANARWILAEQAKTGAEDARP